MIHYHIPGGPCVENLSYGVVMAHATIRPLGLDLRLTDMLPQKEPAD